MVWMSQGLSRHNLVPASGIIAQLISIAFFWMRLRVEVLWDREISSHLSPSRIVYQRSHFLVSSVSPAEATLIGLSSGFMYVVAMTGSNAVSLQAALVCLNLSTRDCVTPRGELIIAASGPRLHSWHLSNSTEPFFHSLRSSSQKRSLALSV